MAEQETSQTLDRGLAVLDLLATPDHVAGLSVTELARALEVGRTVIYRLVATLAARDYVTRMPDGVIRLGVGAARLSAAVRPMVSAAARPILRELAEATGATAHLTLAEGEEALALVVVEPSWTDFHVAYRVGSRHRLDQGAAGKAILAGRAGTGAPVTSDGELQAGAHGVAVPVPGVPGLEASVGVVALGALDADRHAAQVSRAARRIAAELS